MEELLRRKESNPSVLYNICRSMFPSHYLGQVWDLRAKSIQHGLPNQVWVLLDVLGKWFARRQEIRWVGRIRSHPHLASCQFHLLLLVFNRLTSEYVCESLTCSCPGVLDHSVPATESFPCFPQGSFYSKPIVSVNWPSNKYLALSHTLTPHFN